MKHLFSSAPWLQNSGLALVRIITGFFMIYHGWEIFEHNKMDGYLEWDMFKNSFSGRLLVYVGKGAELMGGFFLLVGWFTRIAAIILILTMSYISFFVGHGKIWYDDQYPFLFVLLGLIFIFTGPGKYSADYLLSRKR